MPLRLTVHRGTREIGGNCIEISHPAGCRLVLDAGRPLDAPEGATGLLPASLDRIRAATVLISHPHQDHYGLLSEIPDDWLVWTGEASARLITITGEIASKAEGRSLKTWSSRSGSFAIGPFEVTPILTDHSAFDAYMLLIEGEGRRILYTGDFRRHGRKSGLVDAMMASPPHGVDVLVTEGTNLGTDKPVRSESDLETDFTELLGKTSGRLFVSWSGQNVDRTVTLYRAAKRMGRTLVIDLYTADVLDRIATGTRLPCAGFPNLKVVITGSLAANYRARGREDFIERMVKHGVSARAIPTDAVVMLRRALIRDYERNGVVPTAIDAFNFSMWKGYLETPYYAEPMEWCRSRGAAVAYIHTSGHASPKDLRAFAAALAPKVVVPVHGSNWDREAVGFEKVRRLADGEAMTIL